MDGNRWKLTEPERLILINQYSILELLSRANPTLCQVGNTILHDPEWYRRAKDIVRHGYDLLLHEVTQDVHEKTLTIDDQRDILDILEMFGQLQRSFDALVEKGSLTERDLDFPGWDGNSPKGELWFAMQFCFRDEDVSSELRNQPPANRFQYVRPSPAYNGHFPNMGAYQRMLASYSLITPKLMNGRWRTMTYEELEYVLDSSAHPESELGREVAKKRQAPGAYDPHH